MEYSQALFEAITDSAVLLDKTGRIIDWNSGATSLFGYPKKEVIGRSLNLIYQQNLPFPKIIQEILHHQKRWHEETGFIRKNSIKGFCKTNICLVNHGQHSKIAALVTHHNITPYKIALNDLSKQLNAELKEHLESHYLTSSLLVKSLGTHDELEKALRESELRFHLLAENATDIISRHAPNGTYLYLSPTCKTLLGYEPEELLGRNAYKLLHYDDVNKLKKAFTRRKERHNSPNHQQTVAYRIRRKEGDYRWFESNVRVIYDEDKRTIREIQSASGMQIGFL